MLDLAAYPKGDAMAKSLGTRARASVLGAVILLAIMAPNPASAVKPANTCSPGFGLGALTFEQALALPRTQAGLTAGFYTVPELASLFGFYDRNGDGLLCVQASGGSTKANDASAWQYLYNLVDNNASKP